MDTKKEDEEFKDNKELYRFTKHANENLPLISSSDLKGRQFLDSTPKSSKCEKQNKNLVNELNLKEKSEVFKEIFFERFASIVPNINDFIRKDEFISIILMHNMTRISPNGVVQITDKNQDLPHWVMSAMKCLANCELLSTRDAECLWVMWSGSRGLSGVVPYNIWSNDL